MLFISKQTHWHLLETNSFHIVNYLQIIFRPQPHGATSAENIVTYHNKVTNLNHMLHVQFGTSILLISFVLSGPMKLAPVTIIFIMFLNIFNTPCLCFIKQLSLNQISPFSLYAANQFKNCL